MTFQDVLGIATLIITLAWMTIAYVVFILQTQTFKSQLDMQKLDYERFLLQIRPMLIKGKSPLTQYAIEEYENTEEVFFSILATKNALKDLYVFCVSDLTGQDNLNQSIHRWHIQNAQVDDAIRVIQGNLSYRELHVQLDIKLIFKDELNNCYSQSISGRITRMTVSPPEKISLDQFNFFFKHFYVPDFEKNPMKKPKLLRKDPKDPYS